MNRNERIVYRCLGCGQTWEQREVMVSASGTYVAYVCPACGRYCVPKEKRTPGPSETK